MPPGGQWGNGDNTYQEIPDANLPSHSCYSNIIGAESRDSVDRISTLTGYETISSVLPPGELKPKVGSTHLELIEKMNNGQNTNDKSEGTYLKPRD